MNPQDTNTVLGVGTWGAIASSMAAIIAVIFQNMIAIMKTRGEIEHQRAQDDVEHLLMAKRLAELEERWGEHPGT